MAVYKSKKPTKDGRQYFFRIKYKDIFGEHHDYTSMKFKTLKEATSEEARYRIKISDNKTNTSNITLEQAFYEYQDSKKDIVKKQSLKKEVDVFTHIKPISKYKINNIDLNVYRKWHNEIEKLNFCCSYKNRILSVFKRIIVYANQYYNTSDYVIKFIKNFKNTEIKKEMEFFTYDEYLKFDSVIDDHMWHTFFEILYFLGLRQGECMALTWKDVVGNNLNINKTLSNRLKGEQRETSTPKTKNSIRILPLTEKIKKDLDIMKSNAKQYIDYSDDWFIFGNTRPLV